MKSDMFRTMFSVLALTVMVLGVSGCRSKKGATGEGLGAGEILGPINAGDVGWSNDVRGEFGVPISDVEFENVTFAYDSFTIVDSERRKIEAVADYMVANPQTTVVIDGHCDERGSREYNLSLGEHRALAIRAYLISLGVAGDRIHTRSFGEEQPLDLGHSDSSWLINRRGEFSLYRE